MTTYNPSEEDLSSLQPEIIDEEDHLPVAINDSDTFEEDFNYAIRNYKELIDKGKLTIETLTAVFEGSEHPRAAEVLANTISVVSNINKEILQSYKLKRDISKQNDTNGSVVNNTQTNLFVGTTAELQKLIKQAKGEIDE